MIIKIEIYYDTTSDLIEKSVIHAPEHEHVSVDILIKVIGILGILEPAHVHVHRQLKS